MGTVHGGGFATLLDSAAGRVVHVGGRMATAEGRPTGSDGRLYAHASTTCFIFDAP
jgi:acyl-coenzyme A thioesterase PaaI-like protein